MPAFLRKTGVVDDPGHHRSSLLHRGQDMLAHLIEQRFVTPVCLGYQMMQRLTHRLNSLRIETGSHWLNALALAGQQ
jgi:hypothetical protein